MAKQTTMLLPTPIGDSKDISGTLPGFTTPNAMLSQMNLLKGNAEQNKTSKIVNSPSNYSSTSAASLVDSTRKAHTDPCDHGHKADAPNYEDKQFHDYVGTFLKDALEGQPGVTIIEGSQNESPQTVYRIDNTANISLSTR